MSRKSYIERKEAWAEKASAKATEQRTVRSEARLPPGQHQTKEFPVLDLGIRPEIPENEWALEITGLVEYPVMYNWESFGALPKMEDVSDFHCVTTWSRFDCRWGGVAMETILDAVRPLPGASHVFFTSYDGYTTNVSLGDLWLQGAMLATHFDGKPLTLGHGAPVRVVLPHLYAWKAAKFVRKIEFRDHDEPGYWEKRGYSMTADPWLEERFSV